MQKVIPILPIQKYWTATTGHKLLPSRMNESSDVNVSDNLKFTPLLTAETRTYLFMADEPK